MEKRKSGLLAPEKSPHLAFPTRMLGTLQARALEAGDITGLVVSRNPT
ncbi:MAG: hypothetical protein J0J01_12135 [Reyranella sp.]|nr:hypothetical protein [Reyranella sp.]MBN9087650.1 hypothetical protein [Reyranella sp.]